MPTATTFTLPRDLLGLIRGYSPFQVAKRIPLEATVEACYEQTRPQRYTERLHLFLQLKPDERSSDKIFEHYQYSPLELSLDLYPVREMYKLLKQGKTARFSGYLIVYADWLLLPLGRLLGRKLVGTITVDNKSYSVKFEYPSTELNPRLRAIRSI